MQIQTKKLNRVRLVNWMYFGYETFPINLGSVLISGENAAGKSDDEKRLYEMVCNPTCA